MTLSLILLDASFPDYRRVIPQATTPAIFDRSEMLTAVRKALLIQDHRERVITFKRSAGSVEISARSEIAGQSTQMVEADCQTDMVSTFNGANLCTVLESVGGEVVEFHQSEPMAPALLRRAVDDGSVGVIGAMRA